jgi:hypothetical protein
MNKIIFLCLAATALPVCAMEEAQQENPRVLTAKDAQEEFLFWRCKKVIKLCGTLESEPYHEDEKDKKRKEICAALLLAPPPASENPRERTLAAFKDYLTQTSFGLCMSHQFQRKDLQALQAEWKTVAQLTHSTWWPGMAEVMFLKKSLTLFKDIRNPNTYQHERKPFNLLAFNLKKCAEFNNALRSIQENVQPIQPKNHVPIAWHASEKERDAAFREAIFQQGPC